MKNSSPKSGNNQELASEYRFDYSQAKPNRFAEKMNSNIGWTVEKFVAEEKKESGKKKVAKAKAKAPAKKPAAKAKPAKRSSPKGKKKK